MPTDLERIERDVLDLRAEFQAFRAEVHGSLKRLDEWLIRQETRAEAREEEDTQIRRLPGRVAALESTDGARHWTVRLAESDRGYSLLRMALVAGVLCCLALGGGLAWGDLSPLIGSVTGATIQTPQPAPP